MSRAKLIGLSAVAVAVLGYGGFAAMVALGRMDVLNLSQVLIYGTAAALVGEVGLWVAAACLGWTLFKGRKAILDRLFRRRDRAV